MHSNSDNLTCLSAIPRGHRVPAVTHKKNLLSALLEMRLFYTQLAVKKKWTFAPSSPSGALKGRGFGVDTGQPEVDSIDLPKPPRWGFLWSFRTQGLWSPAACPERSSVERQRPGGSSGGSHSLTSSTLSMVWSRLVHTEEGRGRNTQILHHCENFPNTRRNVILQNALQISNV